ncbi:MAG: ATP-binding protein [Firmicutes bacterium]|nr:ATP-binding protein [Bacillota bacterium]
MLVEFKTRNYKTFVEEATLSMVSAPKQKGLDYSVRKINVGRKKLGILPTGVIYGTNAAGKSNIISALDTLKAIVERGNINNSNSQNIDFATSNLELIPNSETKNVPTEFDIKFYINKKLIEYIIKLDIGEFLKNDAKRKVIFEKLSVNNNAIFERDNEILLTEDPKSLKYFDESVTEEKIQIANNSLNDTDLFLCNGFRLIFAKTIVGEITDWFKNKLFILFRSDAMQLIKRFDNVSELTIFLDKATLLINNIVGHNCNKLAYLKGENDKDTKLVSILPINGQNVVLDSEVFESFGTLRLVNIFPIILRAMQEGTTLVIDEFDTSIHPMAIAEIINIFHNDDINTKFAQLVFNTHNPIFLNKNLFRRDEIKFIERDNETLRSEIYSLSDFGTGKDIGVRKNEDYLRNYINSKYGAIKEFDFTPIFKTAGGGDADEEKNNQ